MKSTAKFASSYFWHHENLIKKVEPRTSYRQQQRSVSAPEIALQIRLLFSSGRVMIIQRAIMLAKHMSCRIL